MENVSRGERKTTILKEKIRLKQLKPILSDPDVKKHLEELDSFLLSPLIKHQIILPLFVEDTIFPNYW